MSKTEIYTLNRLTLLDLLSTALKETFSIASANEIAEAMLEDFDKEQNKAKESEDEVETLVGHLSKPYGINNHELAEVGHPVYSNGRQYILYLKPLNDKLPVFRTTFNMKPFTIAGRTYDFNNSVNF